MKNVIEIKGMNFAFDGRNILENIGFSVEENDFVGVIGPNGGGKTTLLKIILGLLTPQKGSVKILGSDAVSSRKYIGYAPQFGTSEKSFPIKTIDVVAMGLCGGGCFFPWVSDSKKEKALEVMNFVKIQALAEKPFNQLSGGEQQRALIARAIAADPKILLLDEPTSSVDSSVEEDIYETLRKLNEKITIILVSHDIGFISNYVNKVACVNKQATLHRTEEINSGDILKEVYSDKFSMIKHQCKI